MLEKQVIYAFNDEAKWPWPYGVIVTRTLKRPPRLEENYGMNPIQHLATVQAIVTGIREGAGAYVDSTKSVANTGGETQNPNQVTGDLRGVIYGMSIVRESPISLNMTIVNPAHLIRFLALAHEGLGAYTAACLMYKIDIYFTHVTIKNALISNIRISLVDSGAEVVLDIVNFEEIRWDEDTAKLPIERAYEDNGMLYGKTMYENSYLQYFGSDNTYTGAIAELPQCAVTGLAMDFAENVRIVGTGTTKYIDIYSPSPPTISIDLTVLGNDYQFSAASAGSFENIDLALSQYNSVREKLDARIYGANVNYMNLALASGVEIGFMLEYYESTQSQLMQGKLVLRGQIYSMLGTVLGLKIDDAVSKLREETVKALINKVQQGIMEIFANKGTASADVIEEVYGDDAVAPGDTETEESQEDKMPDIPYDPTTMPIKEGDEPKYWYTQLQARINYLINNNPIWGPGTELSRLVAYRDARNKPGKK